MKKLEVKVVMIILITFIITLCTNSFLYAAPPPGHGGVNKTELTQAINDQYVDNTRRVMVLSREGYTSSSWNSYVDEIGDAKDVEDDRHASQFEVNKAIEDLLEDRAGLRADLTAYNQALENVDEEDYTIVSWTAYQLVVTANVVTSRNTPAEVSAATTNIENAQLNLVLKADLTAYNAAIAAVHKWNYTKLIWDTYQAVVDANPASAQDTQAAVDAATANIIAAQRNLIADLTEYNTVLGQVDEANCTANSWRIYQITVNNNIMTINDTQPRVDLATLRIRAAQWFLKVDPSAYNALIIKFSQEGYTKASWDAYQLVLSYNILLDSDNVEEVTTKTRNIIDIQGKLEADLTEYNRVLNLVTEADYTTESWAIYQAVVTANIVTVSNTPAEVTAATDLIRAAQCNLVFAGKANLDIAIANANSKVQADYTPASYTLLVNALALPQTTNAEIVAKTNTINSAIGTLVFVGREYLDIALANANSKVQADYTTESWLLLTNALALPETTNAEVLLKTIKINDALNTLVFAGKADLDAAYANSNGKFKVDYTAASWELLVAAKALPQTTNSEIVAKTLAINNAVNSLVFMGKANLDVAKANAATKVESIYTVASYAELTSALALPETNNALIVAKTIAINNAISGLELKSVKYRVTAYLGLNCRVSPTIFSNRVRTYMYGTILDITEIVDGWGKTVHGWVCMSYAEKTVTTVPAITKYEVVPYIGLNCRVAPSIYATKVTAYAYKAILEISEILSGWGKTQRGWVCMLYLRNL